MAGAVLSSEQTRLIYSASEKVYALSYGDALFHWSVLEDFFGRVGVVGRVALAAGRGTVVDAGAG